MHSDLDQAQRDEVMFQFKSGQIDVLVATDILSRGIDIDDIAMVINYDVPHDAEDYVHRIGRTARADRDGAAITLVSKDDIYYFQQIEKFLEKEVEKVELPEELGEAPDYTADGKPQRKRSSAKSVRRKNRDQTAHKRKPRRNKNEQRPKEVDAKSEQTNEKQAQERSKTADKQPAKNRQKSNKRNSKTTLTELERNVTSNAMTNDKRLTTKLETNRYNRRPIRRTSVAENQTTTVKRNAKTHTMAEESLNLQRPRPNQRVAFQPSSRNH